MNTHTHLRACFARTPLLALALACGAATTASAETLRLAPENIEHATIEKLTGQKVIGLEGETLGTIRDFAIALPKGSPVYAVVSGGGLLRRNDTLRLIPTSALQAQVARGEDGFRVPLDAAAWSQIAPLDERSWKAGTLRFTPQQHDRLTGVFRTDDGRAFDGPGLNREANLVRASELRRKSLHAGNEEIGDVEGVLIDLHASTASVLLEADDDFAGTEQDVLVPFEKITVGPMQNKAIGTTLTRDDFTRILPTPRLSARDANTINDHPQVRHEIDDTPQPRKPARVAHDDDNLTPTGRTEPASDARDNEELLGIGARSVASLLKAEPAFARADVDVRARHGHIILSGSAPTEKMREQIYETAKGATGFPVLNNIVVKLED